ncbi:zinc ribbon domain-containing protein [Tuwongella immobilis]|uniref:Uncharacterized protein n=1 Tax=Tuwongella immobilis TaxID=692036 RepID=A0A6C2YNZ1_9BACT|nr:hypothetical protein [Tuwongella immobilis]VIP03156.1 unnamed protein product [Tuwongella immobilis]VTS03555.1 unnamed protein product [Tuwongella immobilis]
MKDSETTAIHCPACHQQVRVPTSMFGTPVQCPHCYAMFQAPKRLADGTLSAPERLPDLPPVEPELTPPQKRHKLRESLMFPAMLVLLVGLMGVIVNGTLVTLSLQFPESFRKFIIQELQMFNQFLDEPLVVVPVDPKQPANAENPPDGQANAQPVNPPADVPANPDQPPAKVDEEGIQAAMAYRQRGAMFGLLMSLLSAVGAFQAIRLKTYQFAMVGCVASMVNLVNCCCIPGFPAGVWLIITLIDSDAKEIFATPAPESTR